jgi:hypothetical protein
VAETITVTEEVFDLTIDEDGQVVVVTDTVTEVVEVATYALTIDSSETTPITASATLSALRVIATDASGGGIYASRSTAATRDCIVGISTNACNVGETCHVKYTGIITDAGWAWTRGPVYVSTNGQMTQTAPTSGYVRIVGYAINATTISINLQSSIVLA